MENTGDMTELQRRVMAYLNEHDVFCRDNGIQLAFVSDTLATARVSVAPHLLNASDVVQGGAIFALCDLAYAGVANSGNERTVAQNASISYLRPGTGRELVATAKLLHRGRRTAVIAVEVVNDAGKLIAAATITGCPLGIPLLPEAEA